MRYLWVFLALCVTAALLAACGGGGSGSTTTETSESGSTEANATAPEEGGSTAEIEGKTIGYIDILGTAAVDIRFQNAFKEAASHLGWTVDYQDAQGEQEKTVTIARNMVNSGVDAIVTSSLPAEWILPVAPEAEAKNIPIMNIVAGEPGDVYTGQILEPQPPTAQKLSEQVVKEFPQGAEVGIFYAEEPPTQVKRKELLEKDFEGTKIKVVAAEAIPYVETSKVQKATVDILNSHPNISAFLTTADVQAPEVVGGLRTAGNSKVKVYSYYADSVNVGAMKENPTQFAGVVDSDVAIIGWSAADELAKYFAEGSEIKKLQEANLSPLIVTPSEITPAMEQEEGPVPFAQIGAPFYKEWETKYGVGN